MEKDIESIRQARSSFNRILSNSIYADIIKDDAHLDILLNLLKGNNYKSILDIGTGTGYLAFPLAKIYPTAQVRGIDIAEKVIEQNIERAKEQNYINLTFQSFDGIEYPFEEESFDLIVTRYAFHHFPNIKNSIQQMKNLLNRGGKLLISDPLRHLNDDNHMIDDFMRIKKDGHIQFYSKTELDELFISNGFIKEKQIITHMSFPFAKSDEYNKAFENHLEKEKLLYNIEMDNGIVWVKHIEVGNTIYVKP